MRGFALNAPIALIAPIALSACGSPGVDTVGGETRSEAQALNDAAMMLDNNAVSPAIANESAAPR